MSFKRRFSIFISSLALLFAGFASVVAAQDSNNKGGGGNGLQISPTRTEVSIQPGESKKYSFVVKNITAGALDAKVSINDFESDGVTGNPKIIVDETERTPTTISNFVKGLDDFSLNPGDSKKVEFTVDVPTDAAPGAYYGVVRYAAVPKGTQATDEQRQLSLTASLGHLVLIEVAGDINEQIQVDSVKIGKEYDDQGNKSIKTSSIFIKKPDRSLVAIKNLGNGFSRPFGNVVIKDFKGSQVFNYEINSTQPKGVVLPNSSRTFTDPIDGVKTPGRYSVIASVAYGNGGEVVTYKTTFWYLPIWFLLTVLAIIVALVVGGYITYKKKFASTVNKKKKAAKKK